MIQTIITEYAPHQSSIRHIRDEVFLKEQNIALEDELDGRDDSCLHALAFVDDSPVGTGRLDIENDCKVGRIAVLPDFRRQGVGTALMHAFENHITTQLHSASMPVSNAASRIWFYAQRSAVEFYVALGYRAVGTEFVEAGIPHIEMEKRLG